MRNRERRPADQRESRQRGAATAEHAGLSLLVGLFVIAAVAALASAPSEAGRDLGFALARKLRCGAQGPGPCWRDPLTEAYGRPMAGAVRALAPVPRAIAGVLPVDFRSCRNTSCAMTGERYGLTASNRRVAVFVAVRSNGGGLKVITYWEYRPGLGWTGRDVEVTGEEIARLAPTPLLDEQVPALVALETLAGANHFDFPASEQPPWRWRVERR